MLMCRLPRQCTTGAPAPYASDFCFGKSHQNHFAPRLPYRDVLMPRVDGSTRAAFGPPLRCVVGNLGRALASVDPPTAPPCADDGRRLAALRFPCSRLQVRGSPSVASPFSRAIHALRSPYFAMAPAQAVRGLGVRRGEGPPDLHVITASPTGPLSLSASPLPAPLRGSAMYRDVRVPRVQDAYERPSAALVLGLTVGAKAVKHKCQMPWGLLPSTAMAIFRWSSPPNSRTRRVAMG